MRLEDDDWTVIFTVFLCREKIYRLFIHCLEEYGFNKNIKSISDIVKYYGSSNPSRYLYVFDFTKCQEIIKSFPTFSWYAINDMWWILIQTQIFKKYKLFK